MNISVERVGDLVIAIVIATEHNDIFHYTVAVGDCVLYLYDFFLLSTFQSLISQT